MPDITNCAICDLATANCAICRIPLFGLTDETKLKPCDGCDLARYCSDECQELHRTEHEGKCKERAAELRDELLFKQPESTHLGDCPICCLPLPFDENFSQNGLQTCCTKLVCGGCAHADMERLKRGNQELTCPFCRHPLPATQEEAYANEMKRIAANDPMAMTQIGIRLCDKEDFDGAFEYFTKSAELGDAQAHFELYMMYRDGECVEQDEKKEVYHLEEAAIRGHPYARFDLAMIEGRTRTGNRAMKHWIIAASLGHDKSLVVALKEMYKEGFISKEFAATLRAHHAAVKATKSPEREAAAIYNAVHNIL